MHVDMVMVICCCILCKNSPSFSEEPKKACCMVFGRIGVLFYVERIIELA